MATLKERVEANVTVWLLGTLLAGFIAGFGAYRAVQEAGEVQSVSKYRIEQFETSIAALKDERKTLAKQLASCQEVVKLTGSPSNDELLQITRDLNSCTESLAATRRRIAVPQTSQWKHLLLVGHSGDQVAERLNEIGPPPQNVVATYDPLARAFHVWYVGGGSGTRYVYGYAPPSELSAKAPSQNYFINDGAIVPAGIGRDGDLAVPLFFRVLAE